MDDQLKQLFDYTKFHIGMYTTLIAGIIGVFANETLKGAYSGMVPYIKVSILLFLVAGAAGGLVASSILFSKPLMSSLMHLLVLGSSGFFQQFLLLMSSTLPSGLAVWSRHSVCSEFCRANLALQRTAFRCAPSVG